MDHVIGGQRAQERDDPVVPFRGLPGEHELAVVGVGRRVRVPIVRVERARIVAGHELIDRLPLRDRGDARIGRLRLLTGGGEQRDSERNDDLSHGKHPCVPGPVRVSIGVSW